MAGTKKNDEQFVFSTSQNASAKRSRLGRGLVLLAVILTATFALTNKGCGLSFDKLNDSRSALGFSNVEQASCPQADSLTPEVNAEIWSAVGSQISTDGFKQKAIEWLSGAVRIPTESYDSMDPVGVDPRWDAFGPFHEYLEEVFPLVHNTLRQSKINTYGLLYEWTGSDKNLQPLLLAAHQDVVPVDPKTVDEWQHPPYSGHFDGERIWGRGSNDDKSGLIGIMSAIETLIDSGFKPTRTVVLAFGFDEETSGLQGASQLGTAMLDLYGEDSFVMVVDEGGGFAEEYGTIFAMPGTAEKGYLDTRIDIASAGGHSSVPPSHTSIGILSALLTHIEDHPIEPRLTKDTPLYSALQCFAEHSANVPKPLRNAIKKSAHSKSAMKAVEHIVFKNPVSRAMVGTTQAIDLIGGGVKTNALPENAWAVVNHRISPTSSVSEAQKWDTKLLKHLAHKFNLTYTAFGKSITSADRPTAGTLTLTDAFGNALEPAPRTPTKGDDAIPYKILSGTIKATYNAHRALALDSDEIKVAPGMPTGNTDTRYYWKLSKHIFRYNHKFSSGKNRLSGVHTVNESLEINTFLEVIRFFTTLILNVDEATVL